MTVCRAGFTPQFGGDLYDYSLVSGVRGTTATGLNWDISGSTGRNHVQTFIFDTVNASLGPDSPTRFEPNLLQQTETSLNADTSYAASDMINIAGGPRVAERAVPPRRGRPRVVGHRPVRRAGLQLRLQRLQRHPARERRHLGPRQRRRVRRRRGPRRRERVEPRRRRPHRGLLRQLRHHDEQQAVGPVRLHRHVRDARRRQQRVPRPHPRTAERAERDDRVRLRAGRPDQQRHHSVHLAGRGAAGRRAPAAGRVDQLLARDRRRHRAVHVHRRLLPHQRVRPAHHHQELQPLAGRESRPWSPAASPRRATWPRSASSSTTSRPRRRGSTSSPPGPRRRSGDGRRSAASSTTRIPR